MFDILFTHPDFLLINKHPNVSVHKDDGETMLLQEVLAVSGDDKLYLVHRLDKMTSGLLLLARSKPAATLLSQLFAAKEIEKYYLAIGSKKPNKKQGTISGDMSRSRRSAWKLLSTQNNPAITQFCSLPAEPGQRLFLCKPLTGKTHQIRVALKSIGSAIIGDPIYHHEYSDRGYLHAFALRFYYQSQWHQFISDPRIYSWGGALWHSDTVSQGINSWLNPWELKWPKSTIKNVHLKPIS